MPDGSASSTVQVSEPRIDRTQTPIPAGDADPLVDLARIEHGRNGVDVVTGTSAQNAPYGKIIVITAATFSAFSGDRMTGMTGVAFPVNHEIRGFITSFTLSGGSVAAYRR